MSPERLKKVAQIFNEVLEVVPAEREIFLQDSCGNDIELRREVESLLSYEDDFDSLIDSAPASLVDEVFHSLDRPVRPGKRFNQYKIERKIGEGGMGAVYLAVDTRLERQVAIKLLPDEFSKDKTRRNRFFREAKSASALNHPNILTVHEIGEFEGRHFIISEFIKGKTLTRYLADEKPSLQSVVEIATQIASALSAAHEVGIIHRDIKPDNIMVREDEIIKVLDFGIAKLIDVDKSSEVDEEADTRVKSGTLPGMVIGTPQYMSPEQARGQKIDLRSDIFSFGVLLYEMIAGKPPFAGSTRMDVIGSILKDEPIPLSEHQPAIPPELEKIVFRTLRKDKEHRYQHIKELISDLKKVKQTLEFDSKLIDHQTESAKTLITVSTNSGIVNEKRFSLVHLLAFGSIAIGIGLAVWWFLPKSANSPEQLRSAEVVSWASKPGEVYSVGSFSPDGKMIAFSSTRMGGKNIWIKQTTSGESVQITKDDFRNENPLWSPNGEEIAFYSTKGNSAGFWRTPVLGGVPKLIATIEDGSSFLRYWSKTGLIYYESKSELFAVNVDSGQIKRISNFAENNIAAQSISISADEKHLAYTTVDSEKMILWAKGIDDETPKKLLTGNSQIKNTVWHPDGERLFFSDSVDGILQIFVADLSGNPPRQISTAERDSLVLDVSPDGSRILYGSANEESDIWGFNLTDNKEFTVASDIDSELWADVSPDGKTIAYQSIKNLSQGNKMIGGRIISKPLDSENQLNEIASEGGLPIWSHDGQTLGFMRKFENKNRIESVDIIRGQARVVAENVNSVSYTLLPYNRIQASNFSWSLDDRQIAYLSGKSGQDNIWLAAADGSNEVRLTDNQDKDLYLNCPIWSPDGKLIAYTSKTGIRSNEGVPNFQIWLVDVETKRSNALTPPGKFLRLLGWGKSGEEILYVSTSGSDTVGLQPEVSIQRLVIKTGAVRTIGVLKDAYLYNIYLSPDAKNISFVAHREDKDNVWLIPATGGQEKKLTANNDARLYFSSMAWSPDGNSIFFGKQSRYSLLSMITNFK